MGIIKFKAHLSLRYLSKNSQNVACPWGIVHIDSTISPLPVKHAYPRGLPPFILGAIRFSRENDVIGAKVSDWNFVGPWVLIPAVILMALEGVRRRGLAPINHLYLKL